MRSPANLLLPTIAASVLLSACGSSASSTGTGQATNAANRSPESGSVVRTASHAKLGMKILVNSQGLTLYHLSGEQGGKLICTSSACLHVWRPLTTKSATPAGSVGSLSKVARPTGAAQVTYKGMPLYTFVQDTAPGQVKGQGIKDVGTWSAVSTGVKATSSPQPAAPAAPATGGGYAY
jgi:predicted lipoprotein with Yx(FWY)xxD motif